MSGQNPASLQFLLGGDAGETAGGINTVSLSVTDDAGATTHFSLRYFRAIDRRTTTGPRRQLPARPQCTDQRVVGPDGGLK